MSTKFNRNYEMTIQTSSGKTVTINFRKTFLTCEFTIQRQNLASVNTATFVIYNLGPELRNDIYKDIFDINLNRTVKFSAGYFYDLGNNFLTECFHGEIKQAYSVREGTNWKTTIECWDGGRALALGFASKTITAGKSKSEIISSITNDQSLPGVSGVVVGDQFKKETSQRATTICGPTAQVLSDLTNNSFYIDNQTAYCIGNNEAVVYKKGVITQIDPTMGILDTPKKNQIFVEVTTLFEPRINPSQVVDLVLGNKFQKTSWETGENIQSNGTEMFNGKYKIAGFTHTGTISNTVSGEYKSTLMLLNGNNFALIPNVTTSGVK